MSLRQGNLFWGMQFRTCKNFWDFVDSKSSLTPEIFHKYKSHTAITSIVVAKATNLKKLVIARRIYGFAEAIHTNSSLRDSANAKSWQSKQHKVAQ